MAAAAPLVEAKSINAADADRIAAGFMSARNIARPAKMQPLVKPDIRAGAKNPYYIYNSPGGGYVIVSGDDRFGDILGYSDSGVLDFNNMPEGLNDMLELYSIAFERLGTSTYNESPSFASPKAMVEPLLGEINWGQDAPFNTQTPISTGTTHFYTGCVACAATQIMKYYNYPAQGYGSKTYTDPLSKKTLSADFSQSVYDWENMPAAVPENPTQQQIDAYSKLASDFGIAVEMQFEASGSGTYDMLVPYALREYFGYDASVRGHQRAYYPTDEWMNMIKTELDEGRPVFYGGSSDIGGGGHAFVIDGYDNNGFVHVNWGWYGRSNGYFKINHLDPESLGEGGGAGGYNLNQDMVTGIRPAREGSKRDHAVYGEVRLSVDGPFDKDFLMMTFVGNIDVAPIDARIEGALVKDGKIIKTLGGDDFSVNGFKEGKSGMTTVTLREVSSDASGVEDGDYRLNMVYKPSDDDQWYVLRHPKGLLSYAKVNVSNGVITLTDKEAWPKADVVLHSALETDGDLYPGGNALLSFTMENRSPDFVISEIFMRLTDVKDPSSVYDSSVLKDVYEQSVESLNLTFPVSEDIKPGEYYLTAYVKGRNNEIFEFDDAEVGRPAVNVLPKSDSPVVRATGVPTWQVNNEVASVPDRITQGETLYILAPMRNAGAPGTARVLARFTNNDTGDSFVFIMTEIEFTDEKSKNVAFSRYVPYDPGTYTVEFFQLDDNFKETAINVVGEPMEITVYPSDVLEAEVVSLDIPDILPRDERSDYKLVVNGLTTVTKTLYLRIRQLNNKNGEIIYMGSKSFKPDTELEITGKYRPGTDLADGYYMIIAETGTTQSQKPMGNYGAYAKIVHIGELSGVTSLTPDYVPAAIWADGRILRVVTVDGVTVDSVDVYSTSGLLSVHNDYDLNPLSAGIYVVRAVLSDGSVTTAKITVR